MTFVTEVLTTSSVTQAEREKVLNYTLQNLISRL